MELHLPVAPREGNAAPALEQAAQELGDLTRKNPLAGQGPHGLMGFAGPGRAVAQHRAAIFPAAHAVGQLARDGKPLVYGWPQLESELANGEVPLARLREALRQPIAVPAVDYKSTKATVSNTWKSFFWLASATLDDLHRADHDAAAANITATLDLASYLGKNEHTTQQIMAVATDLLALPLVWEALQDDGWTDAQLAVLQEALTRRYPMDAVLGSLTYEQVLTRMYFDQLRQSNNTRIMWLPLEGHNIINDLFGDKEVEFPSEWVIQTRSMLWRLLWADQDEARALELWQPLLASARLLRSEKSWLAFTRADPEKRQSLHGIALWVNSFSEALSPQVYRSVLERFARVETQRQMTLAAVAIKRYALRHGALPPSLGALVPEFLPEVPTDWMDGEPLRYRPPAEGRNFVLYSVGTDGRDEGGDPTLGHGADQRSGIWAGRDAVWPTAVMPPEAASATPPAASP